MKHLLTIAIVLLSAGLLRAEDKPVSTGQAFLQGNCYECHSGDVAEGDLSLDDLKADFNDRATREKWLTLWKRVAAGEMPPKSQPRPEKDAIQKFSTWVDERLAEVGAARLRTGRVVTRRLNRFEYENTMRDLLGITVDLADLLPVDTSADGFDNGAAALHTSSFLLDRYLVAAEKSLNLAIANHPQPPLLKKKYFCGDTHTVKLDTERVFLKLEENAVVLFSSSQWNSITMPFYEPHRGRFRFRIAARGYQSEGKPVTFRVDAGPMLMGTKNHLVDYFDVPADETKIIEFVDHLEARSTIRILPFGLATAHVVTKIGAADYKGPGLAIDWVEVEGPLHETWPPESHRRIFGDLPQVVSKKRDQSNRVEVVSQEPLVDARRVIEDFARRAFRRPTSEAELQPIHTLVEAKLADGYSFEQAVRVGLTNILISPEFLFLQEKPGKLTDFALASRLSYSLWSTMPDDALLEVAEKRTLHERDELRRQVDRMLASPKASAFTENFVGQWLQLREIDFTEPDGRLYPEYDDMLKAAIIDETKQFFTEVLANDLSVTNFVASDFAMLNERLAKHYNIPGVEGHALKKVVLPADSHRGGVLTMASVLKVTANGTTTSPVVRGAWVADRILGQRPPPPPSGVPAVEPDIRGATTIREQLAKHREDKTCAACHARMDPYGFALESFDVIGGYREHYRSTGRGAEVTIDGKRMNYYRGLPVDPADALHDGRKFANIDELKQLLLADKEQLARAMTTRLITYATGCAPDAADYPAVEAIVRKSADKDYGLKSIVHEIVQSPLFQHK